MMVSMNKTVFSAVALCRLMFTHISKVAAASIITLIKEAANAYKIT
jgi:hypothetical protein